ncbi:hypothetical protein [Schumannella sp. 10F1B-5-1]|uniref:hypothetical protein n=1 Tax=Schumannella sp. 10F1B-5-1 TaxID=2590780 RepID=UPI001130EEA1|nr:hypothetical protein [Schumannella sp. 10F1B-5-1]TPW78438.1 hypothetical protein FJ658_01135 [Schumannella sp. 10F1B-5-1]
MTMTAPVSALELSEFALEEGLREALAASGSAVAAKSGIAPFVITERAGERTVHRFDSPTTGQSASAARYFLRATAGGFDRAVLVWDGYVHVLGKRVDAVVAEYSEAGAEASTVTARRYRPKTLLRGAAALGPTIQVGEGHPLF